MSEHQWPDREQWAKQRRTAYADMFDDLISTAISDYATPAEIVGILRALDQLWRDKGTALRAANRSLGPLAQQPGEARGQYNRRYYRLSDEERAALGVALGLSDERTAIRKAVAVIREGGLPSRYTLRCADLQSLLAPIWDRYDRAWKAACEARKADIEARPIDDAAWQAELRWREEIDQDGRISVTHVGRTAA